MARRITIKIKGATSENESLRIFDFISQLDAIRNALCRIEDEVLEPGTPHMQYKLVDLSHQSPATVVIEVAPSPRGQDLSGVIADRFMERIKFIQTGKVPEEYDSIRLEAFRNIGPRQTKGSKNNLPKKWFSEISISSDSYYVDIGNSLEEEIDKIVGPDETVQGSISGTLELINIHAHANTFRIYPIIGPKKVDCSFKDDQLSNAIAGINRYVNVAGAMRYKRRDKFPYAITNAAIEIYADENELPSIFDLRGMAPNATGNLSSEEFIGKIRDEAG